MANRNEDYYGLQTDILREQLAGLRAQNARRVTMDPWQTLQEQGVYGRFNSVPEEIASDYAEAQARAEARRRSAPWTIVNGTLAQPGVGEIYQQEFGPLNQRWRGTPPPRPVVVKPQEIPTTKVTEKTMTDNGEITREYRIPIMPGVSQQSAPVGTPATLTSPRGKLQVMIRPNDGVPAPTATSPSPTPMPSPFSGRTFFARTPEEIAAANASWEAQWGRLGQPPAQTPTGQVFIGAPSGNAPGLRIGNLTIGGSPAWSPAPPIPQEPIGPAATVVPFDAFGRWLASIQGFPGYRPQ